MKLSKLISQRTNLMNEQNNLYNQCIDADTIDERNILGEKIREISDKIERIDNLEIAIED